MTTGNKNKYFKKTNRKNPTQIDVMLSADFLHVLNEQNLRYFLEEMLYDAQVHDAAPTRVHGRESSRRTPLTLDPETRMFTGMRTVLTRRIKSEDVRNSGPWLFFKACVSVLSTFDRLRDR